MRDESQAQRLFSTTPNHNSLPSFFFFATIPLLLSVLLTLLTLFSLSCLLPFCSHGITSDSQKAPGYDQQRLQIRQVFWHTPTQWSSSCFQWEIYHFTGTSVRHHALLTMWPLNKNYKNHKSNCNLVSMVWIQVLGIWVFSSNTFPKNSSLTSLKQTSWNTSFIFVFWELEKMQFCVMPNFWYPCLEWWVLVFGLTNYTFLINLAWNDEINFSSSFLVLRQICAKILDLSTLYT